MTRRDVPLLFLAAGAAAGTTWYLSSDFPGLLFNLAVALLILAVPVILWLPRAEFSRIALAWTVGGLIGAYFFGVLMLGAGAIAVISLAVLRNLRAPAA